MKKIITLIIAVYCSLLTAHLSAQSCLPDGINFTTQSQIDSFQINYPGCNEIEGDVLIQGDNIINLNGLDVLTSIWGDLSIYQTPVLTSLVGLEEVTSIGGGLSISYSNALTDLGGFEALDSIGGNLFFYRNISLISLTGLEGLTSIEGLVHIESNFALASLTGLDNVHSIGEGLFLANNDALTSMTGLEELTSIGGNVSIFGNGSLESLTGLEGLTSIGGCLEIGFPYYFWFGFNDALTSLTGLEGLTSIGDYLQISANDTLTSLTGIDNIDAASISGLSIRYNESLSTCEVQSVCDYLASPNGTVQIVDNAIGCNSPEQIQDSCEANAVTIDEHFVINEIRTNPNPFTTTTTFSYTLFGPSSVTICIYNPQGKLVGKIEQEQPKGKQQMNWNSNGLPSGIYFYSLTTGSHCSTGKLFVVR
jgi:hypothetical protein